MSEKPLQFERPPIPILGKVPEEEKKKVLQELQRRFSGGDVTELPDKIIERISQLEYPKRPEEIEAINASDIVLNKIRERFGLEPFTVPEKNIHILPYELFKEAGMLETSDFAVHNAKQQLIALNADNTRKSPLITIKTIVHEMTHLKGFVSFDVAEIKKEDPQKSKYLYAPRRLGIQSMESYRKSEEGEYYKSFIGLNEAIVSELEQSLGKSIIESSKNEAVEKEIKWLNSLGGMDLRKAAAQRRKVSVEEIEWVDKTGNGDFVSSYLRQRKVFNYMIGEIANDTKKTEEEVHQAFFKAHFDGKILAIGHLIESTFGPGSFRVVGMMDATGASAVRLLDHLKKQRIRMKKHEKNKN